jgi:hypothetical protein
MGNTRRFREPFVGKLSLTGVHNPMIHKLAAFRRYAIEDRRLAIRTALLFMSAHVLLALVPLPRARRGLAALARLTGTRANGPARLAWSINAVNRTLPGRHSCLIHAVCCEAIAANSDIQNEFRIGAVRAGTKMQFHAWVEHAGAALTGIHQDEFVPLV